jgi:hypothetical protein
MFSDRFKRMRAVESSPRSSASIVSKIRTSLKKLLNLGKATNVPTIVFLLLGILAFFGWLSYLKDESPIKHIRQLNEGNAAIKTHDAAGDGAEFSSSHNRVFIAENAYDGSTPVTLEAWIQPGYPKGTIVNLNGMILIQSDDGKPGVGPTIVVNLSEVEMVYFHSTEPLIVDEWHHIAAVYDGETIRIFVDGKEPETDIFLDDGVSSVLQAKSPKIGLHRVWPGFKLVVGSNSPTVQPKNHYPFHGRIASVMISSSLRYKDSFVPTFRLQRDGSTLAHYVLKEDLNALQDYAKKSPPAWPMKLNR